MPDLFSIGEFSCATHLSVKALRHYHDVGLLEPVAVDPASGYRSYSVAQVPVAQIIRRLRDLEMPIDQVRAVLDASAGGNTDARDRVILAHLQQMEQRLEQTQASVASLRALLEGAPSALAVESRDLAASAALAVRATVAWDDAEAWLAESFDRLHGARAEWGVPAAGPDGALYAPEFFHAHVGEVTAFVPVRDVPVPDPSVPVEPLELPASRVVVAVHEGSFAELDRTYAALGSYVTARAIGRPGPIREHYLDVDGDDEGDARTEVAWPVVEPR